jgi:hypothetical protein
MGSASEARLDLIYGDLKHHAGDKSCLYCRSSVVWVAGSRKSPARERLPTCVRTVVSRALEKRSWNCASS